MYSSKYKKPATAKITRNVNQRNVNQLKKKMLTSLSELTYISKAINVSSNQRNLMKN